MSDEMMTIEEAAAYLRMSKDTIRRAIKTGVLPASRLTEQPRGHYRIRKADLDALFRKRPEPPEQKP